MKQPNHQYWWCTHGNFQPDHSGQFPDSIQVIRWYLHKRKKTIQELAHSLGKTRDTIQRVFREEQSLSYSFRVAICQTLAIPRSLLGLDAVQREPYWWQHIYPEVGTIDAGPDGYPHPGQVIRWFRETKGWSTHQLGQAFEVPVTAIQVWRIETKGKGLEDMDRRKALAQILGIPVALLGLHDVSPSFVTEVQTVQKKSFSRASKLPEYRAVQEAFFDDYYAGTGQNTITKARQQIALLDQTLATARDGQERSMIIDVQASYHNWIVWTSREKLDYPTVFAHAKKNILLAEYAYDGDPTEANKERLALAYFHRAEAYREAGNIFLASQDITAAQQYIQHIDPVTQCRILMEAGTIYALEDQQLGKGSTRGLKVLAQAEKMLPAVLPLAAAYDPHHAQFNEGFYLLRSIMARPAGSAELDSLITHAERKLTNPRRLVILNTYLAQHLQQTDPLSAVDLAIETLQQAKHINSKLNRNRLATIYTALTQNPDAIHDAETAPRVARLGIMLNNWQ